MLFAICGATGSGKTEIVKSFLRNNSGFSKMISSTTRAPRPNEQNGIDYYFISNEEFQKSKNNIICIDEYNNNQYGLNLNYLKDNQMVILTPSGIVELKNKVKNVISIRIVSDDIEKQLNNRIASSSEIQDRLKIYKIDIIKENEIDNNGYIDFTINNMYGQLAESVEQLQKIVDGTLVLTGADESTKGEGED